MIFCVARENLAALEALEGIEQFTVIGEVTSDKRLLSMMKRWLALWVSITSRVRTMDKIKDEASVDLMCTLGGPAIHGLSHCEHVEQVATSARIVVLECSDLSNEEIQRTIDTLRARCSMAEF